MTATARRVLSYLLVEDNDQHAHIIEQCLQSGELSSQFRRVSNGTDCLHYLAGEEPFSDRANHPYPDVVLLDVRMPGVLDGLQTLQAIRSDPRCHWLPVIMLTTSDRDADVSRAYELGANGYVVKADNTAGMIRQLIDLHCSYSSLIQLSERKQRPAPRSQRDPCATRTPSEDAGELLQPDEDSALTLLTSVYQKNPDEVFALLERVEQLDGARFASLTYRLCMEQQPLFVGGQDVDWVFLREMVMEKLPQYVAAEQMAGLVAGMSTVLEANEWADRDSPAWHAWQGFCRAYVCRNLCSLTGPAQ